MDAQDYIRQHVGRMAAKKAKGPSIYTAKTIVIPRREKPETLSTFLVFCILLVAFGTLGAMFMLSPKGQEWWAKIATSRQATAVAVPQVPKAQPAPVTPDFMRREDAQQFMSGVNQRVGKLEEEMKVWQHRTWALGVAHNENSVLLDNMDATHHSVNQRGFVRFDENWRLTPVPQNLQLTDEQKKQLQDGIK